MAKPRRALVWTPEAEQDLLDIWTYLSLEATARVADQQLLRIDAGCRTLTRFPHLGRLRTELGTDIRSILVQPYVVFYRLTSTAVGVLRVLHGRRDIDDIFAKPSSNA